MRKGFDFWVSDTISAFLKVYWIFYLGIYVGAVCLTILTGNPFIFLLIAFIPYTALYLYKAMHSPYYNLEKSLSEHIPEFYNQLNQNIGSLNLSNRRRPAMLLYELIRTYESEGALVASYIKNIKNVNKSGAISLLIWFFSFFILVFALYLKSKV